MPAAARRVTVNEVVRVARRAFTALGAGPGCERAAADAVAWLETRGLAGVAALHADLAPLRRTGPDGFRVLREDARHLELAGGGGSAALAAPALVDWLVAAGAGARAALGDVCSPIWLVAALAARAHALPAWLEARGEDGAPLLRAWVDGGGGVGLTLFEDPARLAGRRHRACGGRGPAPAAAAPAPLLELDAQALAARHAGALRGGLQVPARAWEALVGVAREVLVPESERSRTLGAGGGDDNA